MPQTGDPFASADNGAGEYSFYAWYETAPAGNGVWFDISGVKSASIHVQTLATGNTLVVQVSNAPSKPADSTDGVTDQTINGGSSEQFVTLSKLPARWCKLDKTGTDAAYAYLHGLTR